MIACLCLKKLDRLQKSPAIEKKRRNTYRARARFGLAYAEKDFRKSKTAADWMKYKPLINFLKNVPVIYLCRKFCRVPP